MPRIPGTFRPDRSEKNNHKSVVEVKDPRGKVGLLELN
jgi:hypothetical protein